MNMIDLFGWSGTLIIELTLIGVLYIYIMSNIPEIPEGGGPYGGDFDYEAHPPGGVWCELESPALRGFFM
jgi:hypothetical protein